VKKYDMIILDNRLSLQFENIGLFETYEEWIHPVRTIDTYELIFAEIGELKIYEGERQYTVHPGEFILLEPGVEHGGFEANTRHTSFYWLHFSTNDIGAWHLAKTGINFPNTERTMRELMHLFQKHRPLADLTLAKFLLESGTFGEYQSKLAHELQEYLRLHAKMPLHVQDVARHFGYSRDHLSRVYKQEYGYDLKTGIVQQRLSYVQSLLLNTDYTLKEIAQLCGFEDENLLAKFFKYHEKITPSMYRNRYFHIHMNDH
jgi:AraC-like DNA-binding protein